MNRVIARGRLPVTCQPETTRSNESVWLIATSPAMSSMSPNDQRGMRPPRETKKAFARAVNELRARDRRPGSEVVPKTFSGAMEMETNSRPRRPALAPVLAIRKLAYSGGTMSAVILGPEDAVLHDRREGGDELRPVVERRRPAQIDATAARGAHGLDVDVVQDLEVIGHEPDRANQDPTHVGLLEALEQAGSEPRLACFARRLERELPGGHTCRVGHQPAALEKAIRVAPALAHGEAVRGEDHQLGVEALSRLLDQAPHGRDERRVVVEAADEEQLAIPRALDRRAVSAQADVGVVRSQRQADQALHPVTLGRRAGLGDEG